MQSGQAHTVEVSEAAVGGRGHCVLILLVSGYFISAQFGGSKEFYYADTTPTLCCFMQNQTE